jgi:hypothetical protein
MQRDGAPSFRIVLLALPLAAAAADAWPQYGGQNSRSTENYNIPN